MLKLFIIESISSSERVEITFFKILEGRNVSVNIRYSVSNMDMTNETLIVLCWELYEQVVPKSRTKEP